MRAMGLRRIPRLLLAGLVTTTTLATTSTALAAGGAGTPVLAFGSCGISHASLMLDMGGTGASAVVVLPDGKMLVAGIGGFPDPVTLVRLLPDGTLDVSFGHNGGTVTTLFEPGGPSNRAIIKEMAVQPDGRIVLVGASVRYDNPTQHLLFLRYLPDGTPDASFGDAGQVLFPDMGVGEALTVMPDGKLLAAAQGKLVRLVSSGRLDPTFGSGGVLGPGVPGWVLDMALQPDGNVVLGFSPDSDGGIGVARIHPDGTPDLGFGTNGASAVRIPLSYITSIAVDSAGRIVAAGGGSQDHVHVIVTRHLSDGRLDESFGDGGVSQQWFPGTAESEAIDVIVQADGKPVVAARLFDPPVNDFLRARMGLVRLTSTGGPDPSFGTGGFVVAREGNIDQKTNALAATADGGSVVVGTGPVMIRYRGDGPSSVEIPALTPQTCSREAQLTGPADFGTYPVHTTSGLHTFTLTATGPRPVVVNRVGSSEEQFVVRSTTCNGARLARGTSCTVSVVFEATKDGSFYEAVVVWTDAGVSWQSAEANGTAFVSPVGWGWNGLGQLGSGQGAQSLVAGGAHEPALCRLPLRRLPPHPGPHELRRDLCLGLEPLRAARHRLLLHHLLRAGTGTATGGRADQPPKGQGGGRRRFPQPGPARERDGALVGLQRRRSAGLRNHGRPGLPPPRPRTHRRRRHQRRDLPQPGGEVRRQRLGVGMELLRTAG